MGNLFSEPKQTAPKQTAPKRTAAKQTAPKQTAPKRTAAKPTAHKRTAPKRTAPKPITLESCNAAFLKDDLKAFKRQIDEGIDPDSKYSEYSVGYKDPNFGDKLTFLQRAVLNNKPAFVEYLIRHPDTDIFVKLSLKRDGDEKARTCSLYKYVFSRYGQFAKLYKLVPKISSKQEFYDAVQDTGKFQLVEDIFRKMPMKTMGWLEEVKEKYPEGYNEVRIFLNTRFDVSFSFNVAISNSKGNGSPRPSAPEAKNDDSQIMGDDPPPPPYSESEPSGLSIFHNKPEQKLASSDEQDMSSDAGRQFNSLIGK